MAGNMSSTVRTPSNRAEAAFAGKHRGPRK